MPLAVIHTYTHILMVVAAMQGANQGNRTSNLPTTRCWLYPWATAAHITLGLRFFRELATVDLNKENLPYDCKQSWKVAGSVSRLHGIISRIDSPYRYRNWLSHTLNWLTLTLKLVNTHFKPVITLNWLSLTLNWLSLTLNWLSLTLNWL